VKKKLTNQSFLVYFFTHQLPRLFLCLTLFAGGIIILALRIPGWSLFLGLPATQIGLIFLIFSFDDFARQKVGSESLHMVHCVTCGKPTLASFWQEEKICRQCQGKIEKQAEKKEKD